MKRINASKSKLSLLLFVLPLMLILGTMACEGPQGPEGKQGAAGAEGPQGPVGPAGEDGSVMHAGTGTPATDLGKVGDYYLNQNTGELYGPKQDNGWGTPISLQGPPGQDGTDGKDGSQIYSGTGTPPSSLGQEGDYYLNKSTFDLYGPKTGSGWGTPLNLKGTANVLYSSWIDINWNIVDDSENKAMSIPETRITEEFQDTGIIQMYLKVEDSNADGSLRYNYALPLVSGNTSITFRGITTTDQPSPALPPDFSGIILSESSIVNGDGITDITGYQVRYVLIPGGQQLKIKTSSGKLPIDLNNYREVKKYFGIRN